MEGGEKNKKYREELAYEKLNRIKTQSNTLNPKFIVPFASMVRFCHKENSYMNDSINTPQSAVEFINKFTNSSSYLMVPYESWDGVTKKNNEEAIYYWEEAYKSALNRNLIKQKKSYSIAELKIVCNKMIERVSLKNNNLILSTLCFLAILPKINIKIIDLEKDVAFSWNNGLFETNNLDTNNSIKMSSESIHYLFAFDFGIDTLNVNARFFGSLIQKKKLIRCFAPLALNNTGRYISFAGILAMLSSLSFLKQGLRTVGIIR